MNQSTYQPRSKGWNANELFANVKTEDILLSETEKETYRDFFWYDLRAEYDSANLYKHIMNNQSRYSSEFLQFAAVWQRDELNHAQGFSRIYHMMFEGEEAESWKRLSDRTADFSDLNHLMEDEFKLCVLFAYDEHASAMTYKKDTFYSSFGPRQFVEWIRRVRGDEALHCDNLVKLIRHKYPERISETPEVLRQIMETENQLSTYKGTFLFDHDTEHFLLTPEELSNECVNAVLRKITQDNGAVLS